MPTFTEEDKTRQALESQRANLEQRLQGVGVDPNDLDEFDNRGFIKRALNIDEDKGLLMSTFEILNRPQQAVLSGLAGEGFIEGLTGENEISGVEFLDKVGVLDKREVDGVGAFAINMAVGMATDPLTYTGGPIKLLGKAFKGSQKFRLRTTEDTINTISIRANEVADGALGELKPIITGKGKNAIQEYSEYTRVKDGVSKTYKVYSKNQLDKAYTLNDGIYQKIPKSKKEIETAKKALQSPSVQTERDVTNLITQHVQGNFGKYDENLVFLQGVSADAINPDITMAYRVKKEGAEDIFVEVANVEVKDFAKTLEDQANFLSMSFTLKGVTDEDGVTKQVIEFHARSKAPTTFSENVLKRFTTFLEGAEFKDNQNIQTLLEKLKATKAAKAAGDKSAKSSAGLKDILSENDLKQLNQLVKDLGFDKYALDPYLATVDATGNLKMISSKEIIKATELESFFTIEGNSLRFKSKFGAGVNIDDLPDYSEEFFSEFFQKQSIVSGQIPDVIQEPNLVMSYINRKALEEESFLRRPAQIAKAAIDEIGWMFNASKDLSTDFIGQIRRFRGKSGQMLHENNKIVSRLRKDLTAKNANAGTLLGEISESAYRIENGRLIAGDRIYTAQEILENFTANSRVGTITTLPRFKSDMAKRNFEDALNGILQDSGVKVAVQTTDKATRLVAVEGTQAELYELFNLSKSGIVGGQTRLDFGRLDISEEAQKFFFENQEQIVKFEDLQKKIQDLLVSELGYEAIPEALRGKMGYMRHTLTQEARKGLKEISAATADAYASRGVNTLKQRTFLGTAPEVNAALTEWAGVPFDVLDNDAFTAMQELIRVTSTKMEQHQVLKAVMEGTSLGGDSLFKVFPTRRVALDELGSEFTIFEKGFKNEFSSMYKNLSPTSQKIVDDYFGALAGGEGVGSFAIHKSAHNILKQIDRAYMDLPKFVKGYDKFLNYWKSVTLISPGFHMRNLFGNYANSYVAGMSFADLGTYTTSSITDFQTFYRIKDQAINQGIDTLEAADQEIYRRVLDFFESGGSQTRKGTRDLELLKDSVGKDMLKGDTTKFKKAYSQIVKANFDLAEYMDDIQRYSLYQWALKNKGGDVVDILRAQGATEDVINNAVRARAYETVSGALFDYQNLTTFERDVMKRVFPFYTFMKNNFIFQAKSLLAEPFKYAQMGRAYKYINEDIGGIEMEDMPDYMQENMWIALPMTVRKDDKDAISFLKLNLPTSDFAELVENPFKRGIASVTAPVKIAIEFGIGRDAFTGQPLERFPGETRRLEQGKGVLPFLRDPRGTLAITSNPTIQKVINDLGFRMPQNYISVALDGLDRVFGYKKAGELTPAVFERFSLTATQNIDRIELTKLYQDLNRLRDLQKYYAQESGEALPSLEEISRRQGRLPGLP